MAHSSRLSSVPFLSLTLMACATLVAVSAPADAAIPTLEWQDVETIDTSVNAVSAANGAAPLHWNDSWYVVYVKSDNIYLAERSGPSWEIPVQVSNSTGIAQKPLIEATDDELFIVWEDDRSGHAEIWMRTFDGSVWSSEGSLTDDAVPSRSPSLSIVVGSRDEGVLVWEEGTSPRRIDGAWLGAGEFGPVVNFFGGSADVRDPAVAIDPFGEFGAHLAWVDSRDGSEEVYARWFNNEQVPQPEMRMTELSGTIGKVSIVSAHCCGDHILPHASIAFEHTAPGGVPEVWTSSYIHSDVYSPVLRSADDGIPSTSASLAPSWYNNAPGPGNWCGELGGPSPRVFLSWSDGEGASKTHPLVQFDLDGVIGEELITSSGVGASLVGSVVSAEPRAELAVAWIEDQGGNSALVVQVGDVLSCNRRGYADFSYFTVGPAGVPSTWVRYEDLCTGEVAGVGMQHQLSLDGVLDAAIFWDSAEEKPPLVGEVDADGLLEFSLYGGGCSEDGRAFLKCSGVTSFAWPGVKSPDIDGDCLVTQLDLAYVESQLGTDDFCGDIDWSGLVDELDIAIVEMTLGDACSDVVAGTPETQDLPQGLSLRVHPNPARGPIQLSLYSPNSSVANVDLRVVDAGGRVVADLGVHDATGGWATVEWDGKDPRGRDLPSGMYFAEIRSGAETARETVLIVR